MPELILDNIVFSLQQVGGMSVYWNELISRLKKSEFKVTYLDRNDSKNIYRCSLELDSTSILQPEPYLPLIFERFRNPQIKRSAPFVFHSSYHRYAGNKHAKNVVTVHDFIHEYYYKGFRRLIHSYQKGMAIKRADAIIAISKNTKRDLIKFFPDINPDKIFVIYNGVSPQYHQIPGANIQDAFLFVGSREHYKNFDFSVKAVAAFSEYTLNIVGSPLKQQEINLLNRLLPNRWKIFEEISIEQLNDLYNRSFALLYPSSYEGFGIPILEAMKAGCPFIALKASAIPEVAGNAGVLMKELSLHEFSMALNKIKKHREALIQQGVLQSQKFSWDQCFSETLKVYKGLLNQ